MRLPQETINELDAKAAAEGATRSRIIRDLIERGLKTKGAKR